MKAVTNGVGLKAIAACLPPFKEETKDKRFAKLTGIQCRRIAGDLNASDLGLKAAQALDLSGVEFVIFCSQTHDHYIPFVSAWIVKELGLPSTTGTLDLIGGCAGSIQGLYTAFSICQTIPGEVLFIIGDTLSRTTGEHDPGSMGIFGDAAAAMLVGKKDVYSEFNLNAEFSDVIRMTGGYNDQPGKQRLYMDGDAVMGFALKRVPELINQVSNKVDNFVFHQSNLMILKHFEKLIPYYCGMPVNLDRYGNTSGASIPLAIVTEGVFGRCALIGYGSGLTWGSCETDIDDMPKLLIEY